MRVSRAGACGLRGLSRRRSCGLTNGDALATPGGVARDAAFLAVVLSYSRPAQPARPAPLPGASRPAPPPPPPHPPTPPCCSAADPCPSFPCGAAAIAGVGTADVPDRQKIQCKYNYIEFISTIVLIYKYYCGVFESGVFVVE